MDVSSSSEKEKMKLIDVREFLRENIRLEGEKYFGVTDPYLIESITDNWFDDLHNYDNRWQKIKEKVRHPVGKVLDMASGCGTFVLFGLHHGYDVWGVEPEDWKREYFKKKVTAANYSKEFLDRTVEGVGESLPFADASFDLVTSYQTLEHVQCVNSCIKEMLRVLKPGGVLYIKCPDYNCFFEPHYRVIFLPKMNKKLAAIYLKLIGKPILGLQTLQWTTETEIINFIKTSKHLTKIDKLGLLHEPDVLSHKIRSKLPQPLLHYLKDQKINWLYKLMYRIFSLSKVGRQEKKCKLMDY